MLSVYSSIVSDFHRQPQRLFCFSTVAARLDSTENETLQRNYWKNCSSAKRISVAWQSRTGATETTTTHTFCSLFFLFNDSNVAFIFGSTVWDNKVRGHVRQIQIPKGCKTVDQVIRIPEVFPNSEILFEQVPQDTMPQLQSFTRNFSLAQSSFVWFLI